MTRRQGATARTLHRKRYQHAAELMQKLMDDAGLTPKELAEQSGLPQETVERLLNKTMNMTGSFSAKLSTALGVGEFRLYKVHQAWRESGASVNG